MQYKYNERLRRLHPKGENVYNIIRMERIIEKTKKNRVIASLKLF